LATTGRGETARKTLHIVLSAVAALVVWRTPPLTAATVLAAATAIALGIELVRRLSGTFGRAFQRRLGRLLRDEERVGLTGATTLSVGYTVAAVAVPGVPALAGILFAGFGDAVAAMVGKRFGRLRYRGGKSLAGSLAFGMVVFLLAAAVPGLSVEGAALVAVAMSVVEAATLPVDDNLYLPLAGAAVVWAAFWLMGPR
jgi:dolichol kinase